MRALIFALLLGVASSVFAAGTEGTIRTPSVVKTDMTKREIMVPDTSSSDELKDEDFEELKKYSGIATEENIAVIRNLQKGAQQDPELLMGQVGSLNMDLKDVDEESVRKMVKDSTGDNIEELHKKALERLEQIGRPNMRQKQAPIQQMPSVEEIKKMGLDRYLPDGWEDLVNSDEFQEALKKQGVSASKAPANSSVQSTVQQILQQQQKK